VRNAYPPPITSSRWGTRTKRIVVLVILLLLGFALWHVTSVLPLIIVATLLAYLLWPVANFFESRVLFVLPFRARSLAVMLTFMVVISVFVATVIVIAPVLINQITDIGRNIPQYIEQLETGARHILSQPLTIMGRPILIDGEPIIPLDRLQSLIGDGDGEGVNLTQLENLDIAQTLGTVFGSVGGLTGPAFSVLGGAFTALINLAFLLIIMFYLMRDGERFTTALIEVTPESYRGDVRRLLHELGVVWNAYLRGQLLLCVIVGLAVYVAALVLGLPNAPILGLLAGVLEFIPNVGPIIALIPAVIIALISGSSTMPFLSGLPLALVVIAVYTVIQQIESYILVPRIMGGILNLHPVVVLIALLVGAVVGGALGVILAAPFAATLRVVGQYLYGKIFDTDPFPPVERARAEERPRLGMRVYDAVKTLIEQIHLPPMPGQLPPGWLRLNSRLPGFRDNTDGSGPVDVTDGGQAIHKPEEEKAS
jgi:predicted PurR-regulated permease PerM